MDDADDELEPLECVPLPVSVEAHDADVGGLSTVRLFFRMPGGSQPWLGGSVSEVVVLEQWDRVSIGLVRRTVVGDAPDGTPQGGELLIHGPLVTLDVALQQPLAARALIDASSGHGAIRRHGDRAVPRWVHDDVRHRSKASGSFAGSRSSRTRSSARLPSASDARAAVGVRDLQRHMRRAVSVMLAMRTVLPTSLSSRSLSACHSTTRRAPA